MGESIHFYEGPNPKVSPFAGRSTEQSPVVGCFLVRVFGGAMENCGEIPKFGASQDFTEPDR